MLAPDMIVVYGVAADVCVDYAVLGLTHLDYNVVVVVDTIKAIDNAPDKIYGLYRSWLWYGAWLAGVDYVKKFITIHG